jgi:methionyl-tRNA formyltransferase
VDIKVHKAKVGTSGSEPGLIEILDGRVIAGFSDGSLELETVQPSGKTSQGAQAWMNGRRGEPLSFAVDDD